MEPTSTAGETGNSTPGLSWLPGLGSNQGLQLQRLTCYRYTTGHWRGQFPAAGGVNHEPLSPVAPQPVKGRTQRRRVYSGRDSSGML